VFPLPGERDFLGRDFVGTYGVPAPSRKTLLVFMVFPLLGTRFPGERFCLYLRCSRSLERDSLERDFVGSYGVSDPAAGYQAAGHQAAN